MDGTASAGLTGRQWRVVILASLGGSLEFYDFIIYGVFAQFIAAQFFPSGSALVSLLLTFATFAIGYLARPVGGIVLSHFGDRHGRRAVFLLSVLVMSVSTVVIGLLPTYASWGGFATLAIVLLRLLQGFCLGGEIPGSMTYAVETAPRRAGFVCGALFCCVNGGVLVAMLVSLVIHLALSPPEVAAYGWRIAFLFGGVVGLVGYVLRRSLEETAEFTAMAATTRTSRRPLGEVLADFSPAVLVGVLAIAATGAFNGLVFAHMPAYLGRQLHYGGTQIALGLALCLAIESAGILVVGWFADRVPRQLLLAIGALALALGADPFYRALVAHSAPLVPLLIAAGVAAAFTNGVFGCIVADLFPTRIRFSGVALTYNISFTLFSGTAPLIATALIGGTGDLAAPAWYMIACAVVSLLTCLAIGRVDGRILGKRRAVA